jgi:hypothetical protein
MVVQMEKGGKRATKEAATALEEEGASSSAYPHPLLSHASTVG